MSVGALSRDQVRAIDRRAVEQFQIPSIILMENAGRGAAELLISFAPSGPIVICAGTGNNGGDGFVIARHLEIHRYQVQVLLFGAPEKLSPDALTNYTILEHARTPMRVIRENVDISEIKNELEPAEWIVDALLGTGTRGEIRPPMATTIDAINQAQKRVFAVDLPSGLDCDTGRPLGSCVRAEQTATFVALKTGFEADSAEEYVGQAHVIGIGVPPALLAQA